MSDFTEGGDCGITIPGAETFTIVENGEEIWRGSPRVFAALMDGFSTFEVREGRVVQPAPIPACYDDGPFEDGWWILARLPDVEEGSL